MLITTISGSDSAGSMPDLVDRWRSDSSNDDDCHIRNAVQLGLASISKLNTEIGGMDSDGYYLPPLELTSSVRAVSSIDAIDSELR